ncbi:MAG: hypothetical protein KJN93_08985 [Alphaproteobacteria bacterium]|nr:hypothetical protein [Alphaproteobacteria bacterium]NNF23842.1 hypothetical protein [Paracoccaceae bacterium]
MSKGLVAPEDERGVVRVFQVQLSKNEMTSFTAKEPLDDGAIRSPINRTLGVAELDHDFVEVFPAADLQGTGLVAYLTEGLGVLEDEIEDHKARLEGLTGYVMIVRSGAFKGKAARMKANYPLDYIGGYLDDSATRELSLPTPPRAQGHADFVQNGAPPKLRERSTKRSLLALVAIVVAGVVIWMLGANK